MFRLNMDADINGTHRQGTIRLQLADIVKAFGEGCNEGDKTTQEWMFESDTGEVFTLYDWKQYSTPTGLYDWHIGGHNGQRLDAFMAWLHKAVTQPQAIPAKYKTPVAIDTKVFPDGTKYVHVDHLVRSLKQMQELGGDIQNAILELERIGKAR